MIPDLLPDLHLGNARFTLAVLSSMITPALLISACGTFVLSSSNRLGRVVDRVRRVSDMAEEMAKSPESFTLYEQRRSTLLQQVILLSQRAKLLQRGLTAFYIASAVFILTSIGLGLTTLVNNTRLTWLPVSLGLLGALIMFYGAIIMLQEARLAVRSLDTETGFFLQLVHKDSEGPTEWGV